MSSDIQEPKLLRLAQAIQHLSVTALLRRLWSLVPLGGSLPENVWRQRHRFLLGLTCLHAIIIALVGLMSGYRWELSLAAFFDEETVLHTICEGLIVASFAVAATWVRSSRKLSATMVGLGLMTSSAILVHSSGGYIELHFHFFVMVAFLALYQDWLPYVLSIIYVAIHHGVVGVLWPAEVYNHTAALNAPWTWAGIHAFFILWTSVGSVIAWRFNEAASAQTKLILDSTGEGLFGLDRVGKITFVNPAAAHLLGLDARDIVGKPVHDVIHHTTSDGSSFEDGCFPILLPLKDGIARYGSNEIFWRKDSTSFPVDYLSTAVTERGQLTGVVVAFRDVTERKRREEQIEANFKRIQTLREIDQAITSTLDLSNILDILLQKINLLIPYSAVTIRLYNRDCNKLEPVACYNLDEVEWKAEEWRGGRGIPNTVFANQSARMITNVQTDPHIRDREFFKKHGLISYLGVPLIAKGEARGVLSIYTKYEHAFSEEEIKFLSTVASQAAMAIHNSQLYEQTRQQASELDKATKLQADFTAMIAHDLRSPLSNVLAVVEMLKEELFGPANDDQRKWLGRVQNNARSMLDLVSDFLDLSKLEAGHIDLSKETMDLKQLIERAIENYHVLVRDKGISLNCRIDQDLPEIVADSRRLDQVLSNMLSNAVKFTSEGGSIEVGARSQTEAEVEVYVKDTGVGIPKHEIGSLFEKYRQTTSGKTSEHKGTGLGLVICKMIVEAHAGTIWVESDEGKGTAFHFSLPICSPGSRAEALAASELDRGLFKPA